MDLIGPVVLVLACLAASAFFSASETAMLRLRAHELDEDVQEADGPASVAARSLLRSTSRLLVTILLGNNVMNILGAVVASTLAIRYLGERMGILVATGVMTALVLVFAEVLPKAVAARYPRGVAYSVSLPLYLLHQTLRPVHLIFDRAIEPFLRWIAGEAMRSSCGAWQGEVSRPLARAPFRLNCPDGRVPLTAGPRIGVDDPR